MIFPLHDRQHKVSTIPGITWSLILINCLVFFFIELPLGNTGLQNLFFSYGVVPVEYLLGRDLPPNISLPYWYTLFTMMFLHAGILHLGGNMLSLWIFGDNIEQAFGHIRFLLFYLLCGLSASVFHILFNAGSYIPSVGASGAIAGLMAAYLVFFPRHRITLVSYFGLLSIPAFVVILFWMGLQLLNALVVIGSETSSSQVAYLAHLGGFLTGLFIALLYRFSMRPAY